MSGFVAVVVVYLLLLLLLVEELEYLITFIEKGVIDRVEIEVLV